jgi:hypothetical protein
MEYLVELGYNGNLKSYQLSAESHYNARMLGLEKFLEECKIPGTPIEYLTKKKGTIAISVSKLLDRRKIPRVFPQNTFYFDHVERFRKMVREGELPEAKKRKVVKLLLEVGRVLSE